MISETCQSTCRKKRVSEDTAPTSCPRCRDYVRSAWKVMGCSVNQSSHVLLTLPFPKGMEAGDECTPQTACLLWVVRFGHSRGGPDGTKGQLLWVGGPRQRDIRRQSGATFGTDADRRPQGQQNVSTWGLAWFVWPRHPLTLTLAHSPS